MTCLSITKLDRMCELILLLLQVLLIWLVPCQLPLQLHLWCSGNQILLLLKSSALLLPHCTQRYVFIPAVTVHLCKHMKILIHSCFSAGTVVVKMAQTRLELKNKSKLLLLQRKAMHANKQQLDNSCSAQANSLH